MQVAFLACLAMLVLAPAVRAQEQTVPEEEEGEAIQFSFGDDDADDNVVVAEDDDDDEGEEIELSFDNDVEEEEDEDEEIELSFDNDVEEEEDDEDEEIELTFEHEGEEEEEEEAPASPAEPAPAAPAECTTHMNHVLGSIHAEGAECHDKKTRGECVDLCLELEECSAIDWNFGAKPWQGCRCWIHYEHWDTEIEPKLNWNDIVDHHMKITC